MSVKIQRGSEYQSRSVFKWSKRGQMPNGLVFECSLNTGQTDHLNIRQVHAILLSYLLVWYSTMIIKYIFALSELSCVLVTNENMGLCLYILHMLKKICSYFLTGGV